MDFILPDQLHKYENLIDKINQEYKNCEDLKRQLDKENDKIIICNLSGSIMKQKTSHIGVKVFSDIFHLSALYDDELKIEMKQFFKYTHHKFYSIEVHITNVLLQKIYGMNCIINICIRYNETSINKCIRVESTAQSPLLEVIPVDENVVNCAVEAILLTDQCMTINLDSVLLDISYHFQAYDKKRKPNLRLTPILQVTKRYNEQLELKELNEKTILDYGFQCRINITEFISIILKNSYHYLNSDLFTDLISSDKNDFIMQISLGINKCEISYNKKNKICIKATLADLLMLKNYFNTVIRSGVKYKIQSSIQKLKNTIPINIEDTRQYYKDLRNCWSTLQTP